MSGAGKLTETNQVVETLNPVLMSCTSSNFV
jgi:hypothetical protein